MCSKVLLNPKQKMEVYQTKVYSEALSHPRTAKWVKLDITFGKE